MICIYSVLAVHGGLDVPVRPRWAALSSLPAARPEARGPGPSSHHRYTVSCAFSFHILQTKDVDMEIDFLPMIILRV